MQLTLVVRAPVLTPCRVVGSLAEVESRVSDPPTDTELALKVAKVVCSAAVAETEG